MIEALRITVAGGVPYEKVTIYNHQEQMELGIPDLFEDSQIVFTCKDGTFIIPDYKVVLIQLNRSRPPAVTRDLDFVKRLLLDEDLNYADCYVVPQRKYDSYGIPMVFKEFEQISFFNKEGCFILPDYSISCVRFK